MEVEKRFSGNVAAGREPGAVIVAALATTEGFAETAGLAERSRKRLLVVVEELVANVTRHGGDGRDLQFVLTLKAVPKGVSITLVDSGVAFDPTAARSFTGPDGATGGGVGLALIREWACRLSYAREDGRNSLALVLSCDRDL